MAAYRRASVDAAGDTGSGVTSRGTRQRPCGAGEGAVADCWRLQCPVTSGTRGRGGAAPQRAPLQLPDLRIRLGGLLS